MDCILLNDFACEKQCEYEGRKYLVRDNGAILRIAKEGKRPSKLDNTWTFGKKDSINGYMLFAGDTRVHRIVCTAFHGPAPEPNMVVDHIDTNRCNNRPENLRWLTRLENIVLNDITRKKVEYYCGSLEAFLEDPTIIRDKALPPNIQWMKTVTKEEADRTKKRLEEWAKIPSASFYSRRVTKPSISNNDSDFQIKDFVFSKEETDGVEMLGPSPYEAWRDQMRKNEERAYYQSIEELYIKDSLTPGAKQQDWKTPTEFPLCPQVIMATPLQDYLSRLFPGAIFCRNQYGESPVHSADISEDGDHIAVITKMSGVKDYALTEVSFNDGYFIHKSIRTFFEEEGAIKYYTQSLGREWTGGPVFDDFC